MSSPLLNQSVVRWKEWIPLVTQQQRLRNLIRIFGYNLDADDYLYSDISYYYTLHRSVMSAPFYTSEKIAKKNPKWGEIDFRGIDPFYGSETGLVVRVWRHSADTECTMTVWGVYFTGLAYVGVDAADGHHFPANTLAFHMHGGWFTSPEHMPNDEATMARISTLSLNANDVRCGYTADALVRMHSLQRSIKKLSEESAQLHEQILAGKFNDRTQIKESSPFLRKLLNQSKPNVSHEQVLAMRKKIEFTKFYVQLLQDHKARKLAELKHLTTSLNKLNTTNSEEGAALLSRYNELNKKLEYLKECKKSHLENRERLTVLNTQLTCRQKQLISELNYIYPIVKESEDKYTICNVYLPNSEDFDGKDELSLSVALGFTAHVAQMISFIIDVPLRYPVIHYGSMSKIIDHIAEKIPDKDRKFPLYMRGKVKQKFEYAVYLLNKNVAQLRYYCGIVTVDLRATLPNLEHLLHLHDQKKISMEVIYTGLVRQPGFTRRSASRSTLPTRTPQRDSMNRSLDGGLDTWGEPTRCTTSDDDAHIEWKCSS